MAKTATDVQAAIDAYPPAVKSRLLSLRRLILKVARKTPGTGRIEEALRWGQLSYLTSETGSGSTIRIDAIKGEPGKYAVYFHCQSGLIDTFRELYRDQFKFEGNRAIVFDTHDELNTEPLSHCVSLALTYHLQKKLRRKTPLHGKAPPDHHRHRSRSG